MRGVAAGASCLVFAGCAARPPTAPLESPEYARDPQVFIARVAELRGFSLERPVPIIRYRSEAFKKAYASGKGPDTASEDGPSPGSAVLMALGLTHRELATYRSDSVRLLGFYDLQSRRVAVLDDPSVASEENETIAHELVHALQDQHFPSSDVQASRAVHDLDFDAALARKSLPEGDATWVASTLFASQRFTAPRALFGLGPYYQGGPGVWRSQLGDVTNLEEVVAFPYFAGARLCDILRRSGGIPLLDAALRAPPRTTEQVLHPEKYLAGENATPVATPDPAESTELVARGKLGEFVLRTMLLRCNDLDTAVHAADGWGGDGYVVSSRPGFRALRLVTEWDTAADAEQFERAMRQTAQCWDDSEALDGDYDGLTGVTRQANVVAVVRGEPGHSMRVERRVEVEPALARELIGRVGKRLLPSKRFGNVVAWQLPAIPALEPDGVEKGTLTLSAFALSMPVPDGMQVRPHATSEMAFEDATHASFCVDLSLHTFSRESVKWQIRDPQNASAPVLNALEPGLAERVSAGAMRDVNLPIGRGYAVDMLRERNDGVPAVGPEGLRVLAAPFCGGVATLFIALEWTSAEEKAKLETILAGMRRLGADAPSCMMSPPEIARGGG